MREIIIILYVLGALIALGSAIAPVRRAAKFGPTIGGFNALMKEALGPTRTWLAFSGIALGVLLTTAASILSLFL